MTDPRPEFVYRFEKRGLFHGLFLLCCILFVWVLVVLYGESQGWGSDPGSWTGIPTIAWGILGFVVFAGFIGLALAQLVIRERPRQIYRLEGGADEGVHTPGFLQPQDTTLGEELPTTTAEAETDQGPGQG